MTRLAILAIYGPFVVLFVGTILAEYWIGRR
jgi:hypothetical protein